MVKLRKAEPVISEMATAWLLAGMDAQSELTSVDVDPAVQAIARECLGGATGG